ncbi:hypothetical protein KIPB_010348 [Kipferlia bialata]|uniref:Uncharacterized protein n=1 Tax=Kipferlia bialata TaxID=797122 RepID=A0A9K3D538_9EUKA|nr:hypothetical protein KIPB_010348 [Kipferlia bialata]|eukprot:g10348.t1
MLSPLPDYAESVHIPMALSPIMGVSVTPAVLGEQATSVSIHLYSDVDMQTDMAKQTGLTLQVGGEEPVPALYLSDIQTYTAALCAAEGAFSVELALEGVVFAAVPYTPLPTSMILSLSSYSVGDTAAATVLFRDCFAQLVCGLGGASLSMDGGAAIPLEEEGNANGGCSYIALVTLPSESATLEFSVDTGLDGVDPFPQVVNVISGVLDPQASLDTLAKDTPLRTSASSVLIFETRDSNGYNVLSSYYQLPKLLVTVSGGDFEGTTYYCGDVIVRGTQRYECFVNIPATADDHVLLTFASEPDRTAPLIPFGDPIQQRVLGEQQMETVSLTPVILLCIVSLLVSGYALYMVRQRGGYSELLPSLPSVMVSPVRKDD